MQPPLKKAFEMNKRTKPARSLYQQPPRCQWIQATRRRGQRSSARRERAWRGGWVRVEQRWRTIELMSE
jgi:hypothetical protein